MKWTTGKIKTDRPHVEGIKEGLEKAGGISRWTHCEETLFNSRILRVIKTTRFTHVFTHRKSNNTHLQHKPSFFPFIRWSRMLQLFINAENYICFHTWLSQSAICLLHVNSPVACSQTISKPACWSSLRHGPRVPWCGRREWAVQLHSSSWCRQQDGHCWCLQSEERQCQEVNSINWGCVLQWCSYTLDCKEYLQLIFGRKK